MVENGNHVADTWKKTESQSMGFLMSQCSPKEKIEEKKGKGVNEINNGNKNDTQASNINGRKRD